MFCTDRDGIFYLVFNNGVCAFLAGVLVTSLVISILLSARADWRASRGVRK